MLTGSERCRVHLSPLPVGAKHNVVIAQYLCARQAANECRLAPTIGCHEQRRTLAKHDSSSMQKNTAKEWKEPPDKVTEAGLEASPGDSVSSRFRIEDLRPPLLEVADHGTVPGKLNIARIRTRRTPPQGVKDLRVPRHRMAQPTLSPATHPCQLSQLHARQGHTFTTFPRDLPQKHSQRWSSQRTTGARRRPEATVEQEGHLTIRVDFDDNTTNQQPSKHSESPTCRVGRAAACRMPLRISGGPGGNCFRRASQRVSPLQRRDS